MYRIKNSFIYEKIYQENHVNDYFKEYALFFKIKKMPYKIKEYSNQVHPSMQALKG